MKYIRKSNKDIGLINDLYFDESAYQNDIAEQFSCDQSTVSRVVNNVYLPYDQKMAIKLKLCISNIAPLKNESKQAKTLRKKRELLHSNKLTWKQVSNIRDQYFIQYKTQVELAKNFGVNQSTISKIVRGANWKRA